MKRFVRAVTCAVAAVCMMFGGAGTAFAEGANEAEVSPMGTAVPCSILTPSSAQQISFNQKVLPIQSSDYENYGWEHTCNNKLHYYKVHLPKSGRIRFHWSNPQQSIDSYNSIKYWIVPAARIDEVTDAAVELSLVKGDSNVLEKNGTRVSVTKYYGRYAEVVTRSTQSAGWYYVLTASQYFNSGADQYARWWVSADYPATTQSMYRLYNPNSGEHFYTANAAEKNHLAAIGWTYEGVGWVAPISGGDPVYRLYNPNAGDHHYTMSAAEKNMLVNAGWTYEGVGWRSATNSGRAPLYREYNPNAKAGAHNYTLNKAEDIHLGQIGWKREGIAWYAIHA